MKVATTLILLTGMGLAVAGHAQTPPSPTQTQRERTMPVPAQAPTPAQRADAQGNRPMAPTEHDNNPSKHNPNDTRAGGAGDAMTNARQTRDAARMRCQSAGDAQRQPCMDRADQDYAANVRDMERTNDGSRR